MAILMLLIVFLFPVAIYLSILAAINRRSQPFIISGSWDFAGLLLAVSGFLLVTGPSLISLFYREGFVNLFFRGRTAFPQDLVNIIGNWGLYLAGYYALLVAGSVWLLWSRRKATVIYNVTPELLETTLTGVLDRMRLGWQRRGKRLWIVPGAGAVKAAESSKGPTAIATMPTDAAPEARTGLLIDTFPLFQNVTLQWSSHEAASELREEIERQLGIDLANTFVEENPAAGWFLGIAALLFLIMIFSTALVILFSLLRLPGT